MSDEKKPELTFDPQTGNMVLPHQVTGGISGPSNPDHLADLKNHPELGKKFDEEGKFVG